MRRDRFSTRVKLGLLGLAFALCGAPQEIMADYRPTVLSAGPIGYWGLDETDDAVATNVGTLGAAANGEYFGDEVRGDAGPELIGFGPDNRAIRLDAGIAVSGVTVELPLLDDLSAFTLSGWINPEAHEASNRAGLFGQDNAIEFGFIGPSNIQMWAELPGGGNVNITSTYLPPNDEWHHIAITGDGESGEVLFYVDGEEAELASTNAMPLLDLGKDSYGVSGSPFQIGGGPIFGNDTQFVGAIDEVAVFDRALPAELIKAQFQSAFSAGDLNVGDFNGDGTVDLADFAILTANFNQPGDATTGDTNFSLTVDLADFLNFRRSFNAAAGAATATSVPEPSTWLLSLLSTALVGACRRRTARD